MTEELKCDSCNEVIDFEEGYAIDGMDGNTYCEECESSLAGYANACIRVPANGDGERESLKFCKELGTMNPEYYEWEHEYPEPIKREFWVHTDAWRGYSDIELNEGYTVVTEGWSTGRWGDVPWKHSFNDLCDGIQSGELFPPVDVWFIFCLTSNVFSLATDVVVREGDLEEFKAWLEEVGIGYEALDRAMG